ncbi:unnamed protein product [Paramecium pentaurelia]|uniref:Uncharacterized protein n=1 Tax=Paramecium pentaurelia TaxID=43138 RepID=A0A8S1T4T7_9CILI|nr:unnamed protein product [Paramecium pentaurelia]
MQFLNYLDIVDAGLSFLCCIIDIQKLDINISIGMICRIIFFIVAIMLRDLNYYTLDELIAQLVGWFIFHVYIICFEYRYFKHGESDMMFREKYYKFMDTCQLIVGTTFLAYTFESIIEILTLVYFSINLALNVFELIHLLWSKKSQISNYNKRDGFLQMYFGLILGILVIIFFLIYLAIKYQEDLEEESLKLILYITIFGEFSGLCLSFLLYCIYRSHINWSNDLTKGSLGFLYGITVGLFSVFYGLVIGFAVICYIFYFCCYCCIHDEKKKVHPESQQ